MHEIYAPVRVNEVVKQTGLTPGISLDLTTVDPDDGKDELWRVFLGDVQHRLARSISICEET